MSDAIISVKDFSYSYGDVRAVEDITFEVEEGKVFSLLGPNGAGKTTTINVLITLLPMQKGSVSVSGIDLAKSPNEVRRAVGVVFQDETLDRDLTVWETLEFHGAIYSLPKDVRRARAEELIEVVDLTDKRDEFVKNLSGGMKRRLEIIRGLLTRPKVLFLDEPTIGLDPQTRQRIWRYIRKVNEEGVTIFLTTHYMDEADQLSDVIYIMDKGKIIARGDSDSLKGSLGRDMVYLETSDDGAARSMLEAMEQVNTVIDTTKGLVVSLGVDGAGFLPNLMRTLENAGIELRSISMKQPSLDDVFIYYTGKGLEESHEEPPKPKAGMMGGGM